MNFEICLVLMFCGVWIFCSVREHLLSSLLSLEFMVLVVFFIILFCFDFSFIYYSLFYLVMTACEGALGLSILVMMSRSCGGDYFKSLSLEYI